MGTPDPYLLFESPRPLSPPKGPGLLISLPRNWLSQEHFAHHSVTAGGGGANHWYQLLWFRLCSKGLTFTHLLNSYDNHLWLVLLSTPFYRWGNWDTKRQSHLPMPQYPSVRLECFSFLLQVSCTPWGAECLSLTMFYGTHAIVGLWSCRHGNS